MNTTRFYLISAMTAFFCLVPAAAFAAAGDPAAVEAPVQVPEPVGAALLVCGLASMAAMRWRFG